MNGMSRVLHAIGKKIEEGVLKIASGFCYNETYCMGLLKFSYKIPVMMQLRCTRQAICRET
jgi:hypothetical protein